MLPVHMTEAGFEHDDDSLVTHCHRLATFSMPEHLISIFFELLNLSQTMNGSSGIFPVPHVRLLHKRLASSSPNVRGITLFTNYDPSTKHFTTLIPVVL